MHQDYATPLVDRINKWVCYTVVEQQWVATFGHDAHVGFNRWQLSSIVRMWASTGGTFRECCACGLQQGARIEQDSTVEHDAHVDLNRWHVPSLMRMLASTGGTSNCILQPSSMPLGRACPQARTCGLQQVATVEHSAHVGFNRWRVPSSMHMWASAGGNCRAWCTCGLQQLATVEHSAHVGFNRWRVPSLMHMWASAGGNCRA